MLSPHTAPYRRLCVLASITSRVAQRETRSGPPLSPAFDRPVRYGHRPLPVDASRAHAVDDHGPTTSGLRSRGSSRVAPANGLFCRVSVDAARMTARVGTARYLGAAATDWSVVWGRPTGGRGCVSIVFEPPYQEINKYDFYLEYLCIDRHFGTRSLRRRHRPSRSNPARRSPESYTMYS